MKKHFFHLIVALTILSCTKDDYNTDKDDTNVDSNNCGFETVISAEQYENAPSDQVTINGFEIIDHCLKINFSSGDMWEVKLIDSENILESSPPQRNLRLSLKNEELCEAYITKELTFDISNLQADGDKVQLSFTNSDDSILYEY